MMNSMEVDYGDNADARSAVSVESTSQGGTDAMEESYHDAYTDAVDSGIEDATTEPFLLDCYPYSFTPLLLFAQSDYFDKGYSNFNSVAQFFDCITTPLGVHMLENVLYDRKNMLYENLMDYVIQHEMIVICCIDAHFTALKVINEGKNPSAIYYDPLKSNLYRITGDSFRQVLAFLLLKCNYGDSQHIQDNTDHYTGVTSSQTRRMIYKLWRKINLTPNPAYLNGVTWTKTYLNLDSYFLVNDSRNPKLMSVQLTSNTCYFQSYLFTVLCKGGQLAIATDGRSVDVLHQSKLQTITVQMAQHLLEFFSEVNAAGEFILRPLTNSNIILDFYRYRTSPYHTVVTSYLQHLQQRVPDYERQYLEVTRYYWNQKLLHTYANFSLCGAMTSTPNTKTLQLVTGTEGALFKLARSDYYKFQAANFMFGWNSAILHAIDSFCEFNSLRKNQLLRHYDSIKPHLRGLVDSLPLVKKGNKYREYYFLPQYEIGQRELVELHHLTFLMDFCSMSGKEPDWTKRVQAINDILCDHIFWSTQKRHNYEKLLTTDAFRKTKKSYRTFLETFMTAEFFSTYIGLGFSDVNPKEKEINALTQTVFYTTELMRQQAHRQEFEFEKECVNQMARSSIRKYLTKFTEKTDLNQATRINIKIGLGYTYSKYNTLMHFLNVVECYWLNPDISNIQVLGKDIRTLLAVSSQKVFFHRGHPGYYHYGPLEDSGTSYRADFDLAVGSSLGSAVPTVSRNSRSGCNELVIADRVFEYHYLKSILEKIFEKADAKRFKTDNEVLNLLLLSLMLDFQFYEQNVGLLNLPFLQDLQHKGDTKELQVEIANRIYDFDRKNTSDSVTRSRVQELIFETSHKFLINKDFPVQSKQFKLIQELNSDPAYQSYVLLVKIYMSLCQINKSVEVDYYKIRLDEEFRIIIPNNFSKSTCEYLEEITTRYTFAERLGMMTYDDLPVFDLRPHQPKIDLYKIRFDSATAINSMVKCVEISNVLRVSDDAVEKYLVFVADNVLFVDVNESGTAIKINNIAIEVATIFFNEAISFIPCLKYKDSDDVVLFASQHVQYLVDQSGQFNTDYYGMRHNVIEFIRSEEIFVDTNDDHLFKSYKLSELLTESKTVFYYPDYLLQVPNRSQLINLLDLSLRIRNLSFFILVLVHLRRCSITLEFIEKENDATRISGPWRAAILYVLNRPSSTNLHYDSIFSKQFIDLDRHKDLSLSAFLDVLCQNFTRYQRFIDGQYQVIPTDNQKSFLKKIICGDECFHFSEVGTGKTKVILPLLCQTFLSNHAEAHAHFAKGGKAKCMLVILVPEHLLSDATTQVFRYCLNLNFREEYRIYDDIFALMHRNVQVCEASSKGGAMKKIFVTSFNQFKKALTLDNICAKILPFRENILVVADEVDDFLDRNKLVFNICSNKSNAFDRSTLDLFYETSRSAYHGLPFSCTCLDSTRNPDYWKQLYTKFKAIHTEIQDASQSINKNFGIFNEYTLRHCASNIVQDTEGYKSLIARPYESVNRAMPGSYYSDVERTIFLTYVILTEDVAKYDGLFQAERKFISFDYWNQYFLGHLDFDDLVYGHEKLSEILEKHPELTDGLTRYLYQIILRRMEIRDKSRSVSSIDVIFNFDCIGFTGTPFLDNYPTFDYIRKGRRDQIPSIIDRSFYAFSSEDLGDEEFRRRFTQFQGKNSNVLVEYVSSDFIRNSLNEMDILETILTREGNGEVLSSHGPKFNVIVDLCGIFKRSTIHDVRNLLIKCFGKEHFHYIYHIDQQDNSDRILSISSENDVQYNEEFYRNGCKVYGEAFRDKIFFFVDNRNVIGKDIPFQLVYHKHYRQPLFTKSVILAHDVDDFSKIWQAMGRSRTMNDTVFSIYKSELVNIGDESIIKYPQDIKNNPLTRRLYIRNCDSKMAGNISSIYLTLIALVNLSKKVFYFSDDIVNLFLEKMEETICENVVKHQEDIIRIVLGNPVTSRILGHIVMDKLRRSCDAAVAAYQLSTSDMILLLQKIVHQKFEQRLPSNEIIDKMVTFLSGEQKSQMEISYTKQQQKQKQKQQNKHQDSDAMGIFDKRNQILLSHRVENYFEQTQKPTDDMGRILLNLPVSQPILQLHYTFGGTCCKVDVYPTVQFLYSHFVQGGYVSKEVQAVLRDFKDVSAFYTRFFGVCTSANLRTTHLSVRDDGSPLLSIQVELNAIRQNPQYTLAALQPGVYVIGMKDQFNRYDIRSNPLRDHIRYIIDDTGFVLFDITKSKRISEFGPYYIEQYILMEILSKHEISQNVMEYFSRNPDLLQRGINGYEEREGQGFICWRFLMSEATKFKP